MQSKNKKLLFKKSIYYLVGFAPLIITLFIYTYIPEQVPSHYTTVGEIANWDHKGKVLIIPFLLAAFTYFKPRVFVEKFESQSEKSVSDAATMLFLISINLLSMLELFISLKGEDFLSKFNFYNLLSCIICFIFIFLGYIFSNCTRNSTFSIKIPVYFMDNEIWAKIHQNLGSYWMSSSIVFLPLGIICGNHYILCLLILEIILIILLPVTITYFYIKNHKKVKNN